MTISLRRVIFFVLSVCVCPVLSNWKIRLVGGKHPHMGMVEVLHRKKWGEVCDHGWNLKNAKVVCRMLGYPDAVRFTFGDWWGRGTGYFWLDDVKCAGSEYSLELCSRSDWGRCNCQSDQIAGVVCRQRDDEVILTPEPSPFSQSVKDLPVRLLGPVVNNHVSEGVLQVKYSEQWGFVCSKKWINLNARVACGMLGFKDYVRKPLLRRDYPGYIEEVYLMNEVSCSGRESSMVECKHVGWGPLTCEDGFPVNVTCVPFKPLTHTALRLRGAFHLWEGRVEVKNKKVGDRLHWGTVCDDGFGRDDANVVCRSLGFGTASRVYTNAWYGQGVGKIYMDDVACTGWESDFISCQHRTRSNCNHMEDAGVKCNAPELFNNKIRLAGGLSSQEGRVEVFIGNKWGTVCADKWGIEESLVVCRHLDLGFAKEAVIENYFGTPTLELMMSNVKCTMKERSLHQCKYNPTKTLSCKNGKRAGVICTKKLPDLVLNVEELEKTDNYGIEFIPLDYMTCSYEENCLSSSADRQWKTHRRSTRRLLRFTSRIENRGLTDFRPSVDKALWEWHTCHKHFHSMEVLATYDLTDDRGQKKAEGHKASFCLEDTVCDPGIPKRWNCSHGGDQGISPNCYDVYKRNIDCQWIDVTDFPYGSFVLRIEVNPERKVAESDYDNNIAICEAYDYGNYAIIARCHLDHCESAVRTKDGNSKGACCVFPFIYKTILFNSCTKDGYRFAWCSTTSNFDNDRKWGVCID